MQQVELAAAQHLLSTYSSPCFSVKIVYELRDATKETVSRTEIKSRLKYISSVG
jgi:hypothetical protein